MTYPFLLLVIEQFLLGLSVHVPLFRAFVPAHYSLQDLKHIFFGGHRLAAVARVEMSTCIYTGLASNPAMQAPEVSAITFTKLWTNMQLLCMCRNTFAKLVHLQNWRYCLQCSPYCAVLLAV